MYQVNTCYKFSRDLQKTQGLGKCFNTSEWKSCLVLELVY